MNLFGVGCIAVTWVLFGFYSFSQYTEAIRSTHYFWLIGAGYGLIGNLLWVTLAKHLGDNQKIVMYAVAWDAGIAMIGFAIPVIILRNKVSGYTILGLSLVALGTLIVIISQNLGSAK